MNDNEEPIYDFAPLKSFLERKGYQVGTRQAYEPFKPEDVKAEDVTNGSMEFRSDGIFVLGANGQERQVFLYKKDYRMQQYGKPRFHICKCKVIDDFITSGSFRDHYVRANSEPVPVIDIDDGWMEKEVTGLPLCGYCKKIIAGYGNIDTTKFVEMLKASNGDDHEDERHYVGQNACTHSLPDGTDQRDAVADVEGRVVPPDLDELLLAFAAAA